MILIQMSPIQTIMKAKMKMKVMKVKMMQEKTVA